MTTRVVIPARLASSRLPDKPLADIAGQPMIVRVLQRAEAAGIGDAIVVTDSTRIRDSVLAAGGRAELTRADHSSGTDRIGELAAREGWQADDIVVNLQGDEPLIPPRLLAQVADVLTATPAAGIATLATPCDNREEWHDPNVVKVVAGPDGLARYFSRAPIPYDRDNPDNSWRHGRRHLGIYAYRVAALTAMTAAPPAPLEELERLEQLRAFSIGVAIAVADACERPGPGVDTPADLARVRAAFSAFARVDD